MSDEIRSNRFGVKQTGTMAWLEAALVTTRPDLLNKLELVRLQSMGRPGFSAQLKAAGSIDITIFRKDEQSAVLSFTFTYDEAFFELIPIGAPDSKYPVHTERALLRITEWPKNAAGFPVSLCLNAADPVAQNVPAREVDVTDVRRT